MPLFDFKLHPLEKVTIWGRDDSDGPRLHWFGLTDGLYSMDVTSARLFQYSGPFLGICGAGGSPAEEGSDWVDYQVIRLYEDVLEILPRILEEVSDEVHWRAVDLDRHRSWNAVLSWAFWGGEDDEGKDEDEDRQSKMRDLCLTASQLPSLGSLHLVQGPQISIWSHRRQVYILWDNADLLIGGVPRWAAGAGVYSMPLEEWMAEVESFHNRLMAAMQERIDILHKHNPIPHARINLPDLVQEHRQRQQMLSDTLQRKEETDWDAVIQATRELEKFHAASQGA